MQVDVTNIFIRRCTGVVFLKVLVYLFSAESYKQIRRGCVQNGKAQGGCRRSGDDLYLLLFNQLFSFHQPLKLLRQRRFNRYFFVRDGADERHLGAVERLPPYECARAAVEIVACERVAYA